MKYLMSKIKDENANAIVENTIILPLVFVIIYSLILTAFIVHDRSILESAAKRGTIYATHCICDPNYKDILEASNNKQGKNVDISLKWADLSFSSIGHKVKAYRYLTGSTSKDIEHEVKKEVTEIINNTRIAWRPIEEIDIKCKNTNYVFYQDIEVTIDAGYKIADIFESFGLKSKFNYQVSAKTTVNDPDEFIRNADLVVDTVSSLIEGTSFGDAIKKVSGKIDEIAEKIKDWLNF